MRSERDAHSEMGKLIELRHWKDMSKLDPATKRKPRWEPGDGWGVIAAACWPLALVGAGYLFVALIKWAAK